MDPTHLHDENLEDPSPGWTILWGVVGGLLTVMFVYWVSASFYKVEDDIKHDTVVASKYAELQSLLAEQQAGLGRSGTRKDPDGATYRVIPLERAMELIEQEHAAKKR